MSKVHRPNTHTIDNTRDRYDVYMRIDHDSVLIEYLIPFRKIKRASDEIKRLAYLGLQVSMNGSSVTTPQTPALATTQRIQPEPPAPRLPQNDPLINMFGMPTDD